jgi:hypothetical protein
MLNTVSLNQVNPSLGLVKSNHESELLAKELENFARIDVINQEIESIFCADCEPTEAEFIKAEKLLLEKENIFISIFK